MKRKRLIILSFLVFLVVSYAGWVVLAGPILTARQIQNHDTRMVEIFCVSGVSSNRDAWMVGGIFHCAVASGDHEIVKMLIARKADLNRIDGYGTTPLDIATRLKDVSMMQLLVESGSDVSKRNRSGDTALDIAIREKLDEPRNYLERIGKKAN